MAEIIINKEKHECAPAVAAYVKELDRYNKALLSDIAKKLEEIAELKAENARLEESFQRATGEIAADPLPSAVVDRERFGKAAEEVFDNVKDELDRVAIADFVNQLENALFGGAQ
jgi:DNA repair exonuclease SbcCD ATPase subunit